jgi:hypothetical protein
VILLVDDGRFSSKIVEDEELLSFSGLLIFYTSTQNNTENFVRLSFLRRLVAMPGESKPCLARLCHVDSISAAGNGAEPKPLARSNGSGADSEK